MEPIELDPQYITVSTICWRRDEILVEGTEEFVLEETVEVAELPPPLAVDFPGMTTMLGFDWLADLHGTRDSLIAPTLFTALPVALFKALPRMVGPLPALVATAELLIGDA